MHGGSGLRLRVSSLAAGVLLLVSVGSTSSLAQPGVQTPGEQDAAGAVHRSAAQPAQDNGPSRVLARSFDVDRALREILRRHLLRPERDHDELRRELASIGARDIQIGRVSAADGRASEPNARTATRSSDGVQTLQEGDGKCPKPSEQTHRFNCELLFFHETSPEGTFQSDVAVLMWDFIPVGGNKPKGGPLDDIAAIDFGNYNEKC